MVKINHERPWLKYIDNLNRERKLESAKYKFEGTNFASPASDASGDWWGRMLKIGLTEREWELFFELLKLAAEYFDIEAARIPLILEKGKGKQHARLLEKRQKIYAELLVAGEELVATEIAAQINGRMNGIGNLFSLLKVRLKKDGAAELWDLVNNCVMREAFGRFEGKQNESEDSL